MTAVFTKKRTVHYVRRMPRQNPLPFLPLIQNTKIKAHRAIFAYCFALLWNSASCIETWMVELWDGVLSRLSGHKGEEIRWVEENCTLKRCTICVLCQIISRTSNQGCEMGRSCGMNGKVSMHSFDKKGKAIPLQAWTGPEGSRSLSVPDFKTIGTWRW